jgi:hypothetical protein
MSGMQKKWRVRDFGVAKTLSTTFSDFASLTGQGITSAAQSGLGCGVTEFVRTFQSGDPFMENASGSRCGP